MNHRPLGYEPNELPDCSTPQPYPSVGACGGQLIFSILFLLPERRRSRRLLSPCRALASWCKIEGSRAPLSGSNSAVECQLPKLDVVGSSPISRSRINNLRTTLRPALHCTPLSFFTMPSSAASGPPCPQGRSLPASWPRQPSASGRSSCTRPAKHRSRGRVDRLPLSGLAESLFISGTSR